MKKIFAFAILLTSCGGELIESWVTLYPPLIEGFISRKYSKLESGRPEYHLVINQHDKIYDVTPVSRQDFEAVAINDSLFKPDSSLHLFFYRDDSLVLELKWDSHAMSNYFGKRYYER